MSRSVIFVAATVLGALATMGISMALLGDEPSPGRTGARIYEQTGSAEAQGLTLSVRSATFSGTEPLLEISAARDGVALESALLTIPAGSISVDSVLARSGVVSGARNTTSAFVELPPVSRSGDANVSVASVVIGIAGSSNRLHLVGPWVIPLAGPSEADFKDLMRVENFATQSFNVAGQEVVVNATRSTSRTLVEFTPLSGLTELGAPRLISESGVATVPIGLARNGGILRASYPATNFGRPLSLEFGPYAKVDASSHAIVVDLTGALERIGADRRTSGPVALLTEDIISGDSSIPLTFEIERSTVDYGGGRPIDFGRDLPSGEITIVRFRVAGTFERKIDPEAPSPNTLIAGCVRHGHEIALRSVQLFKRWWRQRS